MAFTKPNKMQNFRVSKAYGRLIFDKKVYVFLVILKHQDGVCCPITDEFNFFSSHCHCDGLYPFTVIYLPDSNCILFLFEELFALIYYKQMPSLWPFDALLQRPVFMMRVAEWDFASTCFILWRRCLPWFFSSPPCCIVTQNLVRPSIKLDF